ncbi:vanadium-dependent haloperoxidase [Gelidibacter gilvus]|uniref:Phosphatase PAP2 family protein n=1 Tax=Gelidibacter gilvus TaxID=59602 RepID=A0A4Q0XEU5_9FLAO|nr:vanadium-dependent haloperoxidase [Gelidibacter gilvus]RXJ44445.1 phosphatase PAP2 family protein [Gelidibacter gilvus]
MILRKLSFLFLSFVYLFTFGSCDSGSEIPEAIPNNVNAHSSDMVIKWLDIQLNMLRIPLAEGTGSQASGRAQAYCGIALYESLVQAMPSHVSMQGQLTDFPTMPKLEPDKIYYWPAVANATLAEMNRKLFSLTSDANKSRIDSLENSMNSIYSQEVDADILERSIGFGKEIALKVYEWAATDGFANTNPPYVPTGEVGTWVSTPPNFPKPANPYASQHRLLTPGVSIGVALDPPSPYSSEPESAFYNMVKEVYDISQVLTPDQKAMALYHRDVPGYPGGGHFIAILSQVLSTANPKLDQAAIAYVKCGITQYDAGEMCFTDKYAYKVVRPITYIRDVMGHTSWNALFNTPGHPEFPAAHAYVSAAFAGALTSVFGDNFQFTLNTYEYLDLPARSYNSFAEMSKEMADSRVFGGIHYQASCDKARIAGNKVAQNILSQINF